MSSLTGASSACPAQPPGPYHVRDGTPAHDRDTLLRIWREALGPGTGMAAKYDWFYLQCPLGAPGIQVLGHAATGSAVGSCTTGCRRMQADGRELRAGLQADLAVVAGHRSLGPALMLQQAAQASAIGRFDLLYGFPNPRATPLFRRLGWTHLADAVRYSRVLRHRSYLARHLPAWPAAVLAHALDTASALRRRLRLRLAGRPCVEWRDCVDPRMDALWASSTHDDALTTVRDIAYLRWRFDDCPLVQTRYLLVSAPDGHLVAWFATRVHGNVLVVCDFWSVDGTRGMAARHVDVLLAAAHEAGHAAVSVEVAMAAPRFAGWLSRGFVERGRRPVYMLVPGAANVSNTAPPYLTAADEDQ